MARYRAAFPAAYKAGTDVADGGARRRLHRSAARQRRSADRAGAPGAGGRADVQALPARNETLVLSEFVPVLEHLGLRVLGEEVIALTTAGR